MDTDEQRRRNHEQYTQKKQDEAGANLTVGLGLRLCENCKHLDDSEEGWKVCDRPNYPEGYKWNLMCSIQRYHDETNTELCDGKYWEPNRLK